MIDKILNWFTETYQEIIDWFNALVDAVLEWFEFLPLSIYEKFLQGALNAYQTFQPPEFITGGTQSLVAALPSDIGYFLAMSGIAQGLSIIGTAYIFRMMKKMIPTYFWG